MNRSCQSFISSTVTITVGAEEAEEAEQQKEQQETSQQSKCLYTCNYNNNYEQMSLLYYYPLCMTHNNYSVYRHAAVRLTILVVLVGLTKPNNNYLFF